MACKENKKAKIEFIDTHAHLAFSQFRQDLDKVLTRAREAYIKAIININCDEQSEEYAKRNLFNLPGIYNTLGRHPYQAEEMSKETLVNWEKIIEENPETIKAIGECGLDFFKCQVPPAVQEKSFRLQIVFAQTHKMPLVIHSRGAEEKCLQILAQEKVEAEKTPVVFHCYGGDLTTAKKIWQKGYHMSFTGIITFKNSQVIQKVAQETPLEMLMLETDAPYLAPEGYRGSRNEPFHIAQIAGRIAELKKISLEDFSRQVLINSEKFFSINASQ